MQIVFIWWTGRQETSVMITGPVLIVGAHSSLVFSLFDPPTFISSYKHCEDKILPHDFLGIHEILEAKSETASQHDNSWTSQPSGSRGYTIPSGSDQNI